MVPTGEPVEISVPAVSATSPATLLMVVWSNHDIPPANNPGSRILTAAETYETYKKATIIELKPERVGEGVLGKCLGLDMYRGGVSGGMLRRL
jgi:hypothetical protein